VSDKVRNNDTAQQAVDDVVLPLLLSQVSAPLMFGVGVTVEKSRVTGGGDKNSKTGDGVTTDVGAGV
jgi:hypothetical protein